MSLYAYNAIRVRDNKTVGVLLDDDGTTSRRTQLKHRHPDMTFFTPAVMPVWGKDLYPVWLQWQCLHTEGKFELQPFEFMPVRHLEPPVKLSVPRLKVAYNPFRLTEWLWGCPQFTEMDVVTGVPWGEQVIAEMHLRHGATVDNEIRRIHELMARGWDDPIIVCTDYFLHGARIMVEEGNHRFAAAIVRGDKTIDAIPVGDMRIIKHYMET